MLVGVEPAMAGARKMWLAAAPSQKVDPTRILTIFNGRNMPCD
jgi:hypothetical protein